jgi:hypothetical protein
MTDPGPRVSVIRSESVAPPMARQRRARPGSRAPYATIVIILTVASTLIAVFDLALFAAGLSH